MVNYIRTGMVGNKNTSRKNGWRKYAAGILAAASISAAAYGYCRNTEYWKPRIHTALSINSPESIEYRLDSIRKDLGKYPELTDRLVLNSIRAMQENSLPFSSETYIVMFNVMKDKIEQKPELLDYLGDNAIEYQKSRMIRGYKQTLKDTYHDLKQKAMEMLD
jgi:hypothetical protein